MAGRIAGITIEIGGDTTKLQKSLKGVDSQLKTTQNNLKDINKLLKLNPGNVELLRQKQKNLNDAVAQTKTRLDELKAAQEGVTKGSAEWDALQREIIETENNLKQLQNEQRKFGTVAGQVLQNAGRQVSAFGDKVQDAGKKLSGISGGAAALGGALLKMGYDSIQSADEINTLAKQTGFTTDEIQKLQYASDRMDVSFESVSGAMKKFKSKIDPANESLKALGVEVTNSDGTLRNANDVFFETVSALSQIENETERDQAAMELFGKSADELAGLIDDGGQAFKEMGDEAENLGLILDQETLDKLNATNDELDSLKANIKGTMATIGANVASVLAPLLEKISTLIANVTERLRSMNPETMETILKIIGVVAALAPVVIIIGKLISGIGSVISIIGTVVGVLGGPLTIAIAAAVAIGVLLYKNWDKIKAFAIKMKDGVVQAFNTMKAKISGIVDNIKAKIEGFKDKVKSIWEAIKSFFTSGITLPHIKLPHFKIIPTGWVFGDLLKGVIPKLSIEWYKKAYDNPMMFTNPTVMATPGGLKGFGDGNGAEIVMGLDKLRELVGGMDREVNVTVVLEGDARGLFKMVNKQNTMQTRRTNYNALAAGGY